MALSKAKDFIDYLSKNPALQEKMSGFTHNEPRDAIAAMKAEGKLKSSNAPGTIIYDCGFVTD